MISVLLNLLRFVLWPKVWSVLLYVQWVLEENRYTAIAGWCVV